VRGAGYVVGGCVALVRAAADAGCIAGSARGAGAVSITARNPPGAVLSADAARRIRGAVATRLLRQRRAQQRVRLVIELGDVLLAPRRRLVLVHAATRRGDDGRRDRGCAQ